MKTKIKIFALLISVFSLFVTIGVMAASDPYVTSYSYDYTEYYYEDEQYWEPCTWNKSNDIYQCTDGSVWQSAGDCDRIGKAPASYYGWNAFNSCTGAYICSNNGVPDPGGNWKTRSVQKSRSVSGTAYVCHYISSVSEWSDCVNRTQYATSVVWSTVSGQSCTNVATTRSCNNPPVASISSPQTGDIFEKYEWINFSGTAKDDIDGDQVDTFEWRKDNCETGTLLYSGGSNGVSSFQQGNFTPGENINVYMRANDNALPLAWSNCAKVTFSVRPACNPENPPSGGGFCNKDNQELPFGSSLSLVQVGSEDECTAERKCEWYYLPVNGKIGDAKNQIFCQRPEENLCDEGDPSSVSVSSDGGFWEWTCKGRYGGTDKDGRAVKSCAYKEVNPN